MIKSGKAKAHSNIALIKYWGKKDEKYIIPMNSSLSLTLDKFFTETEICFDNKLDRDYFYLNNIEKKDNSLKKVSGFIDIFREDNNIKECAVVKSYNSFPTAAGLASSASGFAALTGAINKALDIKLTKKQMSMYARRGSGSASRSIYGGLVKWEKGTNNKNSYSRQIDNASWDIAMIIVIINKKEKIMMSREAMKRTIETSPFYKSWPESAEKDLDEILKAIKDKNFKRMGEISESNSLRMHSTMISARPAIMYFQPESIKVMDLVRDLRKIGIKAYFTLDAGPNVKILCRYSEAQNIRAELIKHFDDEKVVISKPGQGLEIF